MARKEEGLGVTFKVGPGQKMIKRGMEGKLEVSGGKPKARPPVSGPTPGPKKPTQAKPAVSAFKPVESQRKMPRGPMPSSKPEQSSSSEPFISTDVVPGIETSSVRRFKINPKALTRGTKKDDGTFYGNPLEEDRPALYKSGGRVRGDGACRCKTKGKMV